MNMNMLPSRSLVFCTIFAVCLSAVQAEVAHNTVPTKGAWTLPMSRDKFDDLMVRAGDRVGFAISPIHDLRITQNASAYEACTAEEFETLVPFRESKWSNIAYDGPDVDFEFLWTPQVPGEYYFASLMVDGSSGFSFCKLGMQVKVTVGEADPAISSEDHWVAPSEGYWGYAANAPVEIADDVALPSSFAPLEVKLGDTVKFSNVRGVGIVFISLSSSVYNSCEWDADNGFPNYLYSYAQKESGEPKLNEVTNGWTVPAEWDLGPKAYLIAIPSWDVQDSSACRKGVKVEVTITDAPVIPSILDVLPSYPELNAIGSVLGAGQWLDPGQPLVDGTQYSLFLPTNDALAETDLFALDPADLSSLLAYHAAVGWLPQSEEPGVYYTKTMKTLNSDYDITVHTDIATGLVELNLDQALLRADGIRVAEGMIYVIDSLLSPIVVTAEDVEAAATDSDELYELRGDVAGQLTPGLNEDLTNDYSVTVYPFSIGASAKLLKNGLFSYHSSFDPPYYQTQERWMFMELCKAAGLLDELSDPDQSFTVFAPTNAYFENLPDFRQAGHKKVSGFDQLLANPEQTRERLGFHIVPGELEFDVDFLEDKLIMTMLGEGYYLEVGKSMIRDGLYISQGRPKSSNMYSGFAEKAYLTNTGIRVKVHQFTNGIIVEVDDFLPVPEPLTQAPTGAPTNPVPTAPTAPTTAAPTQAPTASPTALVVETTVPEPVKEEEEEEEKESNGAASRGASVGLILAAVAIARW